MIHHVTLELREVQAPVEAAFWELLGFELVAPPRGIAGRALWVQRAGTQIHLGYAADPVVPVEAHVAVIADDYDEALARLRSAGHPVDPRAEHWGAARCYTRTPAGHRVEVMAAPPTSG